MEPGDGEAVAEIYNEGIAGREATFETGLRSGSDVLRWPSEGPVLVCEVDGLVRGWARLGRYSPRPAYAGIGEAAVYVASSFRGRGLGRLLLDSLCEEAGRRGYWKLTGKLFASNEASVGLVRRCGFREVGTHLRHGRLDGEWRDVLVVERLVGEALA